MTKSHLRSSLRRLVMGAALLIVSFTQVDATFRVRETHEVNNTVASSVNDTYDFSAFRNYLDSIESFYGNFSMTVGDSSGILFEYSNGMMNPDVVLNLASGSKWPAVTALVGCFAANNISLDTPMNEFLRWWSNDSADEKSLVTLRHVLSMTSGMISDGGSGEINNVPAANISTVPEQAWLSCSDMNGNVSACAEAMYDAVADVAPVITPGTKFLYSSFGFQWAAAAAEIVEGRSTNDILETYVLQPAGMSPICYWDNQDTNPLLGGGLYCSARKLDRFVHGMLVDKIVSTETRIEMETVQLTDPSMYGTASVFWGPYCLGNWLECLNNLRTDKPMPVQCSRANKHGHPGASICSTFACRQVSAGCNGYWNLVHRTANYYFNFLPSYTCNETNRYCDSPLGSSNCPALYGWAQTIRTMSSMYLDDIFGVGF